jgi:hypothetical protein
MDALLLIGGLIAAFFVFIFAIFAIASLFILAGPPDAHDIDIKGTPKRDG